jgi:fumarylpyruvate hydrolase
MSYVFAPPEPPSVEVKGRSERFPVDRVYCVGRNYEAHAREMGKDPTREPAFFFTKPPDAIDHATIPYPPRTKNLHHEIELVVAIGARGRDVPVARALDHVYGYAMGNDLTRRDLQLEARDKGRPWDTGKAFDRSAAITAIRPAADGGHVQSGTRVLEYLKSQMGQCEDATNLWYRHWIAEGFRALEQSIGKHTGDGGHCFGETVTVADVCRVPQVYNARRFAVDLAPYPVLVRVSESLESLPTFAKARPEAQPDAE